MERDRLRHRYSDERCLPCFALEGEPARVPPHETLRLIASETLRNGTREEFTCEACGQRMVRFQAMQTSPRPSNKWRCERASISPFLGSAPPLIEPNADSASEVASDRLSLAEDSERDEYEY
jgi:hypothetical protein